MKYILFVGHGSRQMDGNEEIIKFVRQNIPGDKYPNTEVCFLEFCEPDIDSGIDTCAQKGASEIFVVPIILLPAGHTKLHIPAAIDNARKKYSNIVFHYARPIDIDLRLLNILDDRIGAVTHNAEKEGPGIENTAVLIIGRGSSDPDANSNLARLARLFWEKHRFLTVEIAFMGITRPTLYNGLEKCRLLGAKRILALPYFLFTGVLMDRMKQNIADYKNEQPGMDVILADYMGFHPLLGDIIKDRIDEVMNRKVFINCDLCNYRLRHTHDETLGHYHHHDAHHSH